jgi:hypothetical protein
MASRLILLSCLLAACEPYALRDPGHVQRLTLETASRAPPFCANRGWPKLHAAVALADGSTLDAFDPRMLRWSSDAGTISADGQLAAPADAREWLAQLGRPVTVRAEVVGNPRATATVVLEPSYTCEATVHAEGDAGSAGGPTARPVPYGQAGAPGYDGGLLDVSLGVVATPRGPLAIAQVTFSDDRDPRYYALDLNGPGLVVNVRGGRGGRGGIGRASNGADGIGGAGGTVRVRYATDHPELRALVHALTDGGGGAGEADDGPDGDAPRYEPVAADALFADERGG